MQKDFHSKNLINASGAWVDQTRALANTSGPNLVKPIAGCHINTKPITTISLLLEAEDNRTFDEELPTALEDERYATEGPER